jgi:hypothetical protein
MLAMPLSVAIELFLVLLLPPVAAAVLAAASVLPATVGLSTVVEALIVVLIGLCRLHVDSIPRTAGKHDVGSLSHRFL